MIEFEVFKKNLDLDHENELNKLVIDTEVIYKGHVDLIEKLKPESDRRKRSLAAAVVGLNNTAAPLPFKTDHFNAWTDIDAQEIFLQSKPTCYLILSKPGAGAYSLGEAIAQQFNCIHLCPKKIIADEIEQDSSTGQCLNFNLKVNNVCNFKTILEILKVKVASPAVHHRGYVISGFPLVNTSGSQSYTVNPLYGEEAVAVMDTLLYEIIYDLKRKKKKGEGSSVSSAGPGEEEHLEEAEEEEVIEEMEEEEADEKALLPKFLLSTCNDLIQYKKPYVITKKMALLEQLNFLFNLELHPDIIIFITCPNKDLVTKKSFKYFNYKNEHHVINPVLTTTSSDLRWPTKYTSSDFTGPIDHFLSNTKYFCRLPMNFEHKSAQQMCNFKEDSYPFIEAKLTDFDPKHVIRLDGRDTTQKMMHHLTETLALLPIKPVIIPEPLYMEEPPEELEEFWAAVEEMNAIRDGVLSFKRNPSLWFNRCPYELKKGKSTMGYPKFAVNFFKHVYLLSSLQAFVSFCRNPRPYLKLKYLEPTCRIIIMGTKSSGKTLLSECLSWLFDARVISYDTLFNSESQKKYDSYAKTILSEIIATIEDTRIAKWENLELEREGKLDQWCTFTIRKLREFITLLTQFLTYAKPEEEPQQSLEEEEESEKSKPKAIAETPIELVNKIQTYKNILYSLPGLDDPQKCKELLNKSVIFQYAPTEILTPTPKPKIPVIGDEDVTIAISAYIDANDLRKEIEPTADEIMTELLKILTDIDEEEQVVSNNERHYGKYIIDGFTLNPIYWNFLVEYKHLPDYVITIMETREIDSDLVKLYDYIRKCPKNYQERYTASTDPLVTTKLHSKKVSLSNVMDVNIILQDIMDDIIEEEIAIDQDDSALIKSFSEALEKFREDLDTLKVTFEENNIYYIDIDLQNKTDIQIIDEMLMNLRKGYFTTYKDNEDDEVEEEESDVPKNMMTYNNPVNYCETKIYCPIAYYDYGVLWEGNPEFSLKYNDKLHLFCKEECLQTFQNDVTKYQSYNKPFKNIPPLRFCVIGPIGSGKTTVSKLLAKELGLVYIDFTEALNNNLLPRHFKKVGRQYENKFTDSGLDDEAVVEFQMGEENETHISDILGNETELRRMVHNYLERGSPVIPKLMQKLIKKLWFDEPFFNKGFVLDGYPRLPTDVEDMAACFCIPDLVIELQSSSELAIEHLSNKMFKTWKSQLAEAKEKARILLDKERQKWMSFITKKIVVKLTIDEILDDTSAPEPILGLSNESMIMDAHPSGSSNVDVNLFTTYNNVVAEFPEPINESVWPKADEVREEIEGRIESIYETDYENIDSLKETLEEQKIKLISIDASKPLNKMNRVILSKVTSYRNRNESLFEETFIVNPDIAELLILEGFFFISKFYRMCPVYIYKNPKTIQNNYNIDKRKEIIFTVIHRSCVYFISGEDSVLKFRGNPLKYATSHRYNFFKEYPLKIGVIGSPKSGKSSLSAKLAKRFGLICISRGKAVRNVIENMSWSELAAKINSSIWNGDCIDSYQIVRAVQSLLIDHRTLTYGFVLDGFPETALEAMELTKFGLYPNLIFDISSEVDKVVKNCQKEVYYDRIKYLPPYSKSFIENRYEKWKEKKYNIRNWINDDYQNIHKLNGSDSRWQCLQNAIQVINNIVPKYHYYLTHVKTKIVPADVMCISNEVFSQKRSEYKNLCPVCFNQNILKNSSFPVLDKKGIVQFRNKFYWICPDHMEMVMKFPHLYLKKVEIDIPELPAVVKTVHKDLVYENGVCIVSYAENLPSQRIIQGSKNFAATFQGKIYMHCSEQCLEKFLAKPHIYADITVFKLLKLFPDISLKKLPDIGYLEQTVGNLLIDACCAVNVLRPKYLGLSYQLSALLYIALYLKTHNSLMNKTALSRYKRAARVYEARCKLLIHVGLTLRSIDNPFAKYPKCCSQKRLKPSDSKLVAKQSSMTTSTGKISITISENIKSISDF